jgi:hypothetical protein
VIPDGARELPGALHVSGEDRLQVLCVRLVRRLALAGMPITWGMNFNHAPFTRGEAVRQAAKNRAMGLVVGRADLSLIVNGRAVEVEFKTREGVCSGAQKAYGGWVLRSNGAWEVCRSLDEMLDILATHVPNWNTQWSGLARRWADEIAKSGGADRQPGARPRVARGRRRAGGEPVRGDVG